MRHPPRCGLALTASVAMSLATLPMPSSATAQEVVDAEPRRVEIEPGGKGVSITLTGRGLDLIERLEVLEGGFVVSGVTVTVVRRGSTQMTISVAADRTAVATTRLEIVVPTRRGSVTMPVAVAVMGVAPSVDPTVVLEAFILDAPSVTAGYALAGTLRLSGPAPAEGVTITLESGTPVQVPSSVQIEAGASEVVIKVSTEDVSSTTDARITAIYGKARVDAPITVERRSVSLVSLDLPVAAVESGETLEGSVTLDGAAYPGGVTVALSAGSPAHVPAAVVVEEGQTQASFTIDTDPSGEDVTVNVLASWEGDEASASLVVEAVDMLDLELVDVSIPDPLVLPPTRSGSISYQATVRNNGNLVSLVLVVCSAGGEWFGVGQRGIGAGEEVTVTVNVGNVESRLVTLPPGNTYPVDCDVGFQNSMPNTLGYQPVDLTPDDNHLGGLQVTIAAPEPDLRWIQLDLWRCGVGPPPVAGAEACLKVNWRVSDWVETSYVVDCTVAGQAVTVDVPDEGWFVGQFAPTISLGPLPAGDVTAECTLDALDGVAETDESNNVRTVTVTVGGG